ncbi:glycoside hydrolase family 88 protein [Chelativorans xinjiangense]|uniref:glycoside hydrolase family 88 protein n=1 Tax=Chelativorans xinjiangense TaxID=2681485 RepID=UPI00135C3BCB|nr:glycoside hydrolase family 88 protein [Chelativorans xinjiangense]
MSALPDAVRIEAIARQTMRWPFRLWGFGEAIALEGLLAGADLLRREDYRQYAVALCLATVARGIGNADHTAPGRALLALYRSTGDARFLEAARRLVALHESFPRNPEGALLVRADQPGWRHQIWVDSMDLIGPLFSEFGKATGEDARYEQAVALTLAHARLLQAENGLFFHGYDTHAGPNGHLWARGNGWALLGMVGTLSAVPAETPGRGELLDRLKALVAALQAAQRPIGLWTTVIGREETYEETTLAAMAAYALRKAALARLLDEAALEPVIARAKAGVRAHIDGEGRLGRVSEATPVGQLATYATRPFGIFPWGQGPLLLMECEE